MAAEAASEAGKDRERKCPTVGQGRAEQARPCYAEGWLGVWGFRDWDASETDDILNTTYTHLYTHTHTLRHTITHDYTQKGGRQAGGVGQAANVIGKPSA